MAGNQIKLTSLDQVEIRAALTNALRRDQRNLESALKVGADDSAAYYTKTTLRQERLLDLLMSSRDVTLTMPDWWHE